MIEIKKFTETDLEFKELARIDNLVYHDFIAHPDNDRNDWKIRDRGQIRNRLLLYKNNILNFEEKLDKVSLLNINSASKDTFLTNWNTEKDAIINSSNHKTSSLFFKHLEIPILAKVVLPVPGGPSNPKT